MLRQEKHYQCADYLSHERKESANEVVELCAGIVTDNLTKSPSSVCVQSMNVEQSPKTVKVEQEGPSISFWRQQMFDWACMVVDSFGMDRNCVAVSMDLLDRFVSRELNRTDTPTVNRDDFQLFSMTCLYVAVKILEPFPRKITVEALVDMSRGFYSEDDIVLTEKEILSTLKWLLHGPTALDYSRVCWELLEVQGHHVADQDMLLLTSTLTEMAVADSNFCAVSNSLVGVACCCLTLQQSGHHSLANQLCHALYPVIDTKSNAFQTVYRKLEHLYGQ